MNPHDLILAWADAHRACVKAAMTGPHSGDDGYEEWFRDVWRPLNDAKLAAEDALRAYDEQRRAA